MERESCLVIFSGGIDSTTCLYWALNKFRRVQAITFDYGQRHSIEVKFARKIAQKLGIKHKIFKIDLTQIGGSALTDDIPIPERDEDEILSSGVPVTYVPFRNGILISIAAAYAETQNILDIVGGWNAVDFSGYPDCRKEFLEAMEKAINIGTKLGTEGKVFKIHFPLINKTKKEIIQLGLSLGADYSYSISCYNGREIPCGKCDSCKLRAKGWKELGIMDHLVERLLREGKIKNF